MIPDLPNLSDPTMACPLKPPNNGAKAALTDYARGGIALLDASRGLNVKNWTCELQDGAVYISSPGNPMFLVETIMGEPNWISMAFDQNMHYNLAYTLPKGGGSFLYWYDAESNRYVTESLGDARTPIIRMDDVRDAAIRDRDIILSYIRQSSLCVRVQRERFKNEYVLATNAGRYIMQCGMNTCMRFQWNMI